MAIETLRVTTALQHIPRFLQQYLQFLVLGRTRQNPEGKLLSESPRNLPPATSFHCSLERLGQLGSRRAHSDGPRFLSHRICHHLAWFADFFSHRNPSPSAVGAYLSPPSPGVFGLENGRPRGSPSTKSMGFQIRLRQQRLGIRSGGPRLETICGSQRTRVDSGGFVSTGVSTKLKNPS